jgi:hypothetical protein
VGKAKRAHAHYFLVIKPPWARFALPTLPV